jgi:hypothetical protein
MTFPAHIASVPNSLRAVQTIVRGFVRSYGRQRMVLRSSVAPCARTLCEPRHPVRLPSQDNSAGVNAGTGNTMSH